MSWESLIGPVISSIAPTVIAYLSWRRAKRNGWSIDGVHKIVNSQRTDMVARIDAQAEELRALKAEILALKPDQGPGNEC